MKKDISRIAWTIALLLCLTVFGWSAFQIYSYLDEMNETKDTYKNAQDMVQIDTIPIVTEPHETATPKPTDDSETTEPTENTEEVEETEPESIYKHLHLSFEIDWESLKVDSKGLVGWLYIPDTNINYPLVKSNDNDYYLNRDYTGKWTSGGSIFLDKRVGMESENVVIYGHHMKADIMFHRLTEYVKQEYADAHRYVYIATEESVRIYEVFAVVRTDYMSDTYTFLFSNDMTMQDYVNKAIKNSAVDMDSKQIEDGTQLIALSTCSGRIRTERIVVHASLIDEYVCEQKEDNAIDNTIEQ